MKRSGVQALVFLKKLPGDLTVQPSRKILGMFGNIWRHLGLSYLETRVLLASGG